jgi:glycosyltransferase involved in cell wall biosynthesis
VVGKLSIVIPCYNEEEVLPETAKRMAALLGRLVATGKISGDSAIWLVDDGSTDRTWPMICEVAENSEKFFGIKLSRNRGHQNALLAGLFTADGDVLVSIDADLQDDINVIEAMIDEFNNGMDVVYGVRKKRERDSTFKRLTAESFYRLMQVMGAETIYNHADFRLLSRRAVEALKDFREVNLFIRGIVPLIGYRSSIVHYDRSERFAGESKYPLRRMIEFALDAITSFSAMPLRMITAIGFAVFVLTVAMSAWILWVRLTDEQAVPGWASTVLPLLFVGGVQILCLGVIGEYLGKIYIETKGRPRYFIERMISSVRTKRGLPPQQVVERLPRGGRLEDVG